MVTALYRRYRPESFADLIGQDHVTEPLSQALRDDRTNHAYLFSGPRGCGKTTSARILARCLNCVAGPTDTPCGVCDSCQDLARGGGGSLDVVEIDAASHGGVDDARDLRERAVIAPVRDRFKVFVIDEAHMVTSQGFNALLKLVEEPPGHVKFVFATTEPDKVLATIRSRTHHYPFHLVPADVLGDYLTSLCAKEEVTVGSGVIPLVVRAGGGSVRDSLSVLDQLIAGSGSEGVDHDRAAALLGFTSGPLLDDVVTALSAADGATLFSLIDRVLTGGQDPRRFIEDLLARFRDLIVIQALGNHAGSVLRAVPDDQLERMRQQAALIHPAELSRAADLTSTALNEMVGASTPRIQVELLGARLLLPDADDTQRGAGARLDRIERWLASTTGTAAAPVPQAAPAEQSEPDVPSAPPPRPAAAAPHAASSVTPDPGDDSTETLRRLWPEVLGDLRNRSRATWSAVSEYAHVVSCADGQLELGFSNAGALTMFTRGSAAEHVAQAVQQQTNLRVRVHAAPFDRQPASRGAPAPGHDGSTSALAPAEPATGAALQASGDAAAEVDPPGTTRVDDQDSEASREDPDAPEANLVGLAVLADVLGGEVLDESDPL